MKLKVKALAMALGTVEALAFFVFALLSGWLNWGTEMMVFMADIFIGYDTTLGGAIVGAIWGFVDGLIGGGLLAWFYNKFAR